MPLRFTTVSRRRFLQAGAVSVIGETFGTARTTAVSVGQGRARQRSGLTTIRALVFDTFGTVVGHLKSGPLTFCRISTDDLHGKMRAYVGEGEITSDRPQSFGGYGVVKIPELQRLMHYVCENGYEHHVSVNRSHAARAAVDALGNYKGWNVYHHQTGAGC